jgi:hypothetical protein
MIFVPPQVASSIEMVDIDPLDLGRVSIVTPRSYDRQATQSQLQSWHSDEEDDESSSSAAELIAVSDYPKFDLARRWAVISANSH